MCAKNKRNIYITSYIQGPTHPKFSSSSKCRLKVKTVHNLISKLKLLKDYRIIIKCVNI